MRLQSDEVINSLLLKEKRRPREVKPLPRSLTLLSGNSRCLTLKSMHLTGLLNIPSLSDGISPHVMVVLGTTSQEAFLR